jgi:hypothetical protein
MAGFADGENNFSDDDLDDLPANALQELENNAIQFTQAATQARVKAPPSSDYGDEFDDEDLDDAVVIDEARSAPAVNPILYRGSPSQVTQRERFRQQRYGPPSGPSLRDQSKPDPHPTFNQPNRDRQHMPVQIQQHESTLAQQGSLPEPGDNVDNLQKQIQEVYVVLPQPGQANTYLADKRTGCSEKRSQCESGRNCHCPEQAGQSGERTREGDDNDSEA